MNQNTLYLLACPLCKGDLRWVPPTQELICSFDQLAYPVVDGIPIMLASHARKLFSEGHDQ